MSEYLPLEKSGAKANPPKIKAAQRKADILTPSRRPQPGVRQKGSESSTTPPVSPLTSLQRMLANRQIQAKLTLGPVDDHYEKEADSVASQVVSRLSTGEGPANQPAAQRQEEEEMMAKRVDSIQRQEEEEMMAKRVDAIQRQEEEEEMMQPKRADSVQRQEEEEMMAKRVDAIQRQEVIGAEGGEIAPEFEQSIQGARSGGEPLANTVRGPMENAFGADFSGVRVHTDSQSDSLNQSIQARAFTSGQDIFFRGGEYSPGSSGGQELLAHELTHVVQQNGPAVQQKPEE